MPKPDKYLFAHEETHINHLSTLLNGRAFAHSIFKTYLGAPYFYDHWIIFNKDNEHWFCNAKMFNAVSDVVAQKIAKDKSFSKKIITRSRIVGTRLYRECYLALGEIKKRKLLQSRWAEIFELFYQLCALGLGAVMSDLEHHRLSQQLDAIVNEKIVKHKLRRPLGEYIGILIQSSMPTHTSAAKKELLKLAKNKPALEELNKYIKKYCWLNYGHRGPALTIEALSQQLKKLSKDISGMKSLRASVDIRSQVSRQARYMKELRLTVAEKRLFMIARDFNGIKAYRTDLMFLTFYTLNQAVNELSRQLGVSVNDLHCLLPQEFLAVLRNKKVPKVETLRQRFNKSVVHIKTFNKMEVYLGNKAEVFIRNNIPKVETVGDSSIIKGFVASVGKVTGVVKIINNVGDIHKITKGDILVAAQTIPQYLPAMAKAAAFVTDIGGITSHAAIVAREMKKPCVIGTKIASKVLHDGDIIEVDAEKGEVRKIK